MRLVNLESLRDDMELARDIPSAALGSAPLVRAGMKLSAGLAVRLSPFGVRALWVQDELGDGIVPRQPLPDEVRRATEHAIGLCLDAARSALANDRTMPSAAFPQLEEAAAGIMAALAECPEAALALDDLSRADSYMHSHSVRVATLGLLLGQRVHRLEGWTDYKGERRFDRTGERMSQLTMGLLIHDIGKVALPDTVLNKPGELTDKEWELVRTHPRAGAALLGSGRVSPVSICIVRDHHERWDGLGYQDGREGTDIHPFARIAAIADVYDAVTSDRPYKPARLPHVGVRLVGEGASTRFDPEIVEHFKRVAMPYPVGYSVALPDGSSGAVVAVDPEDPETPVIRYRDASGALTEIAMRIADGEVRSDEVADTVGVPTEAV